MVTAPRCFVIAEAGVNHNGSEEMALRLVDVAAEAGADAVKFQTFRAEQLVRAGAPKAEYQQRQTGAGDQLAMLRALELSEAAHRAVVARCAERGIEFMSTPFGAAEAAFLVSLGMRRIKVPSGELTNKPLLEYLASFGRPLIVSTGMADLAEVSEALDWIAAAQRHAGVEAEVTVLHCTSSYPAVAEDVNLRAMARLAEATGQPAGYSDHTLGIAVSTAAVALGARVIEKHFTLDRNLPGPDHQASLEPDELAALIRAVRTVEAALGDGIKSPRPSELAVRDVARRSVTLARDVATGQPLVAADLVLLRPGTGIPPKSMDVLPGRVLRESLAAGTTLTWDHLV